jgi:hypothetical protein
MAKVEKTSSEPRAAFVFQATVKKLEAVLKTNAPVDAKMTMMAAGEFSK